MTIVISIRQQDGGNGTLTASPASASGQVLSAGPFPSRAQALAWQEYVHRRCQDGRVLPCPERENTAAPWYGFIVEQ